MFRPNVSKKQVCCCLGRGMLVFFQARDIVPFFRQLINNYENSIINLSICLTFWQSHNKIYSYISLYLLRHWQGLQQTMVYVSCCFCLLIHVAVAYQLLNHLLHPGPVVVAPSHFQCFLRARVAYCWLIVNFLNNFKL